MLRPAVVLALQLIAGVAMAGPVQVWETAGFENPESALFHTGSSAIYVSNVAGEATVKDGNGFISKVASDGTVTALRWVTGLDAPKGLAIADGKLYAADIDHLAEIDLATGKIIAKYAARDAKFLNDVAADAAGNVYVSDMATNTIWRLAEGKFEVWLQDAKLLNPNGLLIEGDRLIVAAWGPMDNSAATVRGFMLAVSLKDKTITPLGDTAPIGHLDGLEPARDGAYYVTDWMAGKLFRIAADGKATVLLPDLGQGAADIGIIPDQNLVLIPRMKDNKLTAFKFE